MSVKIRLARFGKVKSPFYRVVVVDERRSRSSAYIEQVGTYGPMESDAAKMYRIDAEKIKSWVARGAQITLPVKQLLAKAGHGGLSAQTGAKAPADRKPPKIRKTRYNAVKDRVKAEKRVKAAKPPKKKKKEAKK